MKILSFSLNLGSIAFTDVFGRFVHCVKIYFLSIPSA